MNKSFNHLRFKRRKIILRSSFSHSLKKTSHKHDNSLHLRHKSKKDLDKEYIQYCIQINQEADIKSLKEKERCNLLKRCETCHDFINRNKLIFCQYCNDAYHMYCINKPPKYNHIMTHCFTCPRCNNDQMKLKRSKERNAFDRLLCQGCKKRILYKKALFQCEKCHLTYHYHCFKKELMNVNEEEDEDKNDLSQGIVCAKCELSILEKFNNLNISEFFKTQKVSSHCKIKPSLSKSKHNLKQVFNLKDIYKKELNFYQKLSNNPSFKTFLSKKRNKNEGKLKLPKPLLPQQKTITHNSLFRALTVKDIQFSDDLIYPDKDCPEELNNAIFEPTIQPMSSYNRAICKKFKKQSRKGEYGSVKVIDDSIQKFVVQATDDILMNTIICEYTGEVTFLRKKLFAENDSIMDLIHTPSSSTSLIICPEKYGNLARFLSGINNTDKNLKKKQNVYSLRTKIDNSIHIFLLAAKNIKKGEILYYDYNAGGYDGYPTDRFV